jgi:hypothetical protein
LQIRHLLTEKRKARRIWQHTHQPRDKKRLNQLSHKLSAAIRTERNASFQYYTSNLSPTDYTLWKASKSLHPPTTNIPPIKTTDNKWARNDREKAYAFAHYLETVFTPHPTNSNPPTPLANPHPYKTSATHSIPPLKHITPNETKQEISSLKPRKSPGYDLITAVVLKHLPKKALVLLTSIFNAMLHLNYFPLLWKFAQIIMLHKPDKPSTEITSYRPISLLPITSKLFERLLLKRILLLTPLSSLIPNHQFGFRANHSTTQQCHRIVRLINEAIEHKKICSAVFLDIQQAFDKVWHTGLFHKLHNYFNPSICSLLQSYLTNRTYQVKINSDNSNIHYIHSGVPQGSVLGPFLYLLYTADLPTTDNTVLATFADDTAILSTDTNLNTATYHLQHHLNLLQDWFNTWHMKVNSAKSAHITFTNRKITSQSVTINAQCIPTKPGVKYLGLYLDRSLTWKTHITNKRTQLTLKTRKLYWLLNKHSKLSLENKVLLYKTILKPIWTYGIALWGCSRLSNIRILQAYQSKVLRIITGAPWYVANSTLHHDLQIPYITEVTKLYARKHRKLISTHPNQLVSSLIQPHQLPHERRLQKTWPEDLYMM